MLDRKEYKKEWSKKYYINNKERLLKKQREYYKMNIEKEQKRGRDFYYDNKETFLINCAQYRKDNLDKVRKHDKERRKSIKNKTICNLRYKMDLKFNLNGKISTAIRRSLKGNKAGRHWEDLVGYTVKDLIKRLKSTMPEGYNWQDFLNGRLHIDHIIPIAAFNFTKPEHTDFKRCWALSNLQFLPAEENFIKNNRLTKPFQPALCLEF